MGLHVVRHQVAAQISAISASAAVQEARDIGVCERRLLERLVRALLAPDEAQEVLRGIYTNTLHARLLRCLELIRNDNAVVPTPQRPITLPAWRMRRVVALVERDLDQHISLSGLARAAGLSPMYFAVLFRRTTGLRPHDFVVRRRVERAQELLSETRAPIAEIALSVGFQSQAHFTSVFKHVVGTTPHRWRLMRESNGLAA